MRMRLGSLLWVWGVVALGLVSACGRASTPGVKTPSPDGATPVPSIPPTATVTATPTPEPDRISELHLPWNPRDLGWQAYQLNLNVHLFPGDARQPLRLHEVQYTAVASFEALDPTRYWLPEDDRGEDFLYLFGSHAVAGKARPWAYHQNQGRGMWMDGLVGVPWQPLSEDQAFGILQRYLLREVTTWSPDLFLWFPQEGQVPLNGLSATRYILAVADATRFQQVFDLTWLAQTEDEAWLYGQTQWQGLTTGEALLAPQGLLLGLNLELDGIFTPREGEPRPVRLRIQYSVTPVSSTDNKRLAPDPIPLTGQSILPPPEAPDFIVSDLREYFAYMGSPQTGLVWLFSATLGMTETDMRELFQLYQNLLKEMGYDLQPGEPLTEIGMLDRLRFKDKQNQIWYMSLFPKTLQFVQPPGAGRVFLEDADYLGQATLPVVLCGYLGGQALPSRDCLLPDDTVCTVQEVLSGTCADMAALSTPLLLPPESLTCFNAYGRLDMDAQEGRWLCRFTEQAFCEVGAFARGTCPRGGQALEILQPQEGDYTIVVQGHLKPGEVRFFRLPHMTQDFAPVGEKDGVFGEVTPREIMALGLQLEAGADDVFYTVFSAENNEPRARARANAPMVWDWNASHAIVEVRAGATETDFTLTVVAAPWLGQGNVRFEVQGVLDRTGRRYFIRPKPLSTLSVQVRGAGVYVSIVKMTRDPFPTEPEVLVPPARRSRSVVLGYEPDEVLIIVHGPPDAEFVLVTQQISFKPYP